MIEENVLDFMRVQVHLECNLTGKTVPPTVFSHSAISSRNTENSPIHTRCGPSVVQCRTSGVAKPARSHGN